MLRMILSRLPLIGRLFPPSTRVDATIPVEHRANNQDVALILVHGFSGDTSATWSGFVQLLLEEPRIASWDIFGIGYASSLRIDVPGIWSADPDLTLLARGLRTTLSLPPFKHYQRIAIAAHSMGGLVAQRALLDDADLAHRLSHLFLFGTPSNGLGKAGPFGCLKRQVRDMASQGKFITSLRKDWTDRFDGQTSFTLRVVAGDRDEFVPTSSSLAPFADAVQAVLPGNHLEIVRPGTHDHLSIILVVDALTGSNAERPAVDGARLAVELGDFHAAVETLLPRVADLDDTALASLALALEGVGRGADALSILSQHYKQGMASSTEIMGVLAGRIKRRWLTERVATDLTRARELYLSGLHNAEATQDHEQAYYHAINVAFLDLMALPLSSSIPPEVISMAERALNHCQSAPESHWRFATEAEGKLLLGNLRQAEKLYARAIKLTQSPREQTTIYLQAIRVAERVFGEPGVELVERLFGVANQ
ncbi:MAG: alpha/beta hydrolase [Gammaproteobacteria bacterium]|nr:alpha/beta hydrolase [Gammaproteobacteria bacterium]